MIKILAIALTLVSTSAMAQIDFTCLNACTNSGFAYGLCQNRCSYTSNLGGQIKQMDYTCQNRCISQGYNSMYCRDNCSY